MKLHPQASALLKGMEEQGAPSIAGSTVQEARTATGMLKAVIGDGPDVGDVRTITVPVDGHTTEVTLYTPNADPLGLIVFFHGGGFVVGAADDFDAMYRKLVVASDCMLVSLDYRLAPEHPFPAGVNDAYAGLVWAAENLAEGLPIVIAGESSGGNFAAVAAIRARDRGPEIAYQLLIYPVTDHDFSRPSYKEHGDSGLLVGRADMEWFWNHYEQDVEARNDPDASPIRADSLAGLPPAYVVVAEFDPLRDEVRAYAERLRSEGVSVTVDYVEDQLHGFFALVNLMESADQAVDRVGKAIKTAVASEQKGAPDRV
jgi:acetyl esterase